MLASKDFGFMLSQGIATTIMQLYLLKTRCSNISAILGTFTLRLGLYALISLMRVGLGYGRLGRAMSKGEGGTFFKRKPVVNGVTNGV